MKRTKVKNCVRHYREEVGLTQEELAKKVNVSRQTIISIENQDYVPSVLLAMCICKVLNKLVEQVFDCQGVKVRK